MGEREKLLDIAQAAAFLSVSQTSLRRWTNTGQLPHLRVGGRHERRFRRADLLAFMEEGSDREGDRSHHTLIGGISVAHGTHQCGLYASDTGRARLMARFLSGGIRAHSVCYLVGPTQTRTAVLKELRDTRLQLKKDIDAGRLVQSDYAKTANEQIAYFQREMRQAMRDGSTSLRVVGDCAGFAGRLPGGVANYEADYSRLIADEFPVVTLCAYDTRKFSGRDIFRALKGHPDNANGPIERWLA